MINLKIMLFWFWIRKNTKMKSWRDNCHRSHQCRCKYSSIFNTYLPLPSFVLALRKGTWGSSWGSSRSTGAAAACATAIVSTVVGTLTVPSTAEAEAEAPLRGLLVLNSRHFAPRIIIILDTAILGFLAATRGLAVIGFWKRWAKQSRRQTRFAWDQISTSLPDKLAEGFVVGQWAVVLLSEHMVNVFHAPVNKQLGWCLWHLHEMTRSSTKLRRKTNHFRLNATVSLVWLKSHQKALTTD